MTRIDDFRTNDQRRRDVANYLAPESMTARIQVYYSETRTDNHHGISVHTSPGTNTSHVRTDRTASLGPSQVKEFNDVLMPFELTVKRVEGARKSAGVCVPMCMVSRNDRAAMERFFSLPWMTPLENPECDSAG